MVGIQVGVVAADFPVARQQIRSMSHWPRGRRRLIRRAVAVGGRWRGRSAGVTKWLAQMTSSSSRPTRAARRDAARASLAPAPVYRRTAWFRSPYVSIGDSHPDSAGYMSMFRPKSNDARFQRECIWFRSRSSLMTPAERRRTPALTQSSVS